MTPAPSQGASVRCEGPSSTRPPLRSAMVSLLCTGRGGGAAAWRLNILCFAVLTTRERDIEITQWPQRDSCFLCANLRQRVRPCDMHVFVCTCAYMCVYERACLWGLKE